MRILVGFLGPFLAGLAVLMTVPTGALAQATHVSYQGELQKDGTPFDGAALSANEYPVG